MKGFSAQWEGNPRELPGACLVESLAADVAWGTHLGHEVLEAGDDVGAFELLIVAEASSDHNHSDEGQG